jgi:FixJ family two-component response regulator
MSKPLQSGGALLCFGLYLRPPSAPGTMARHGTMTVSHPIIAVVDNDAAVRNSLKFSLEIDGFAVRTYANAAELLGSSGLSNFQCLVVDQDMPRMTGLELVAALRKRGVEVPALLVSGHLTPTVTRQASAVGIAVVEKPFLGNGLIDSIRAAVGTKPS